jgi:hypothetical protein
MFVPWGYFCAIDMLVCGVIFCDRMLVCGVIFLRSYVGLWAIGYVVGFYGGGFYGAVFMGAVFMGTVFARY